MILNWVTALARVTLEFANTMPWNLTRPVEASVISSRMRPMLPHSTQVNASRRLPNRSGVLFPAAVIFAGAQGAM